MVICVAIVVDTTNKHLKNFRRVFCVTFLYKNQTIIIMRTRSRAKIKYSNDRRAKSKRSGLETRSMIGSSESPKSKKEEVTKLALYGQQKISKNSATTNHSIKMEEIENPKIQLSLNTTQGKLGTNV
jgi:hypothetical protein